MGFLKDIEDMPNQFDYSKTFFDRWYRPEHTTVIVAGDVTAAEVLPSSRKYWGGWKPGTYKVEIPQEPPRGRAGEGPRAVERADAAVGGGVPRPGVLGRAASGPPSTSWPTSRSARPRPSTRSSSSTSKESTACSAGRRTTPTRALQRRRPREKGRGRAVRGTRSRRPTPRRRPRAAPSARRAGRREVGGRYGLRTLDNTETIAGNLARFVRYRRSYDVEATGPLRAGDAGRHTGRGEKALRRRLARADDVVEGRPCRRSSRRSRALASLDAAAYAKAAEPAPAAQAAPAASRRRPPPGPPRR
ncbi:MAG: insulinase family protein [Vicinamibacteria bacterium]